MNSLYSMNPNKIIPTINKNPHIFFFAFFLFSINSLICLYSSNFPYFIFAMNFAICSNSFVLSSVCSTFELIKNLKVPLFVFPGPEEYPHC